MPATRRAKRFGPSVALGTVIRTRRTERGLSQESLAAACGLDRTYVGGLERGERNPTLKVLWQLAEALGTAPSALLADAESAPRA
ncbi:MAG: helix-turn-helix transcriptional regulator [Gemmatimonadetes bacterium]|nr:helix-turn-helix transcriptional regulator [Gemmatimonadota bacterium]